LKNVAIGQGGKLFFLKHGFLLPGLMICCTKAPMLVACKGGNSFAPYVKWCLPSLTKASCFRKSLNGRWNTEALRAADHSSRIVTHGAAWTECSGEQPGIDR